MQIAQARKDDPEWDAHNALGDDSGQLSDIYMKQRAEAYAKQLKGVDGSVVSQ